MVNPRHQTPQGQSIAKPGCTCSITGSQRNIVDVSILYINYIYIYIRSVCVMLQVAGILNIERVFSPIHSVESPSTVDPQWDIWYLGSKWNLHTVCLSAVGCEWGTTSVYFGITYVCFIPSRLPVFAVELQYLLQDFFFLSKVSFEGHIQNLQKNSCWFKIWMGFVGPKLIKL